MSSRQNKVGNKTVPMRILGIDPGTATTGFAIIEVDRKEMRLIDFGCIKTSRQMNAADRLHQIAQDIEKIIREGKPSVCVVEKIFFSKNVKTAIQVAEARGVILQHARHSHLEVFEYTPTEIKTSVTGDGTADKIQMQKMLQIIFKLNSLPKPDDAADAIAAAVCHGVRHAFRSLPSVTSACWR